MTDIFLSYNREDQAVARLYAEAFGREGLEVWWDATLRSGEAYDEVTEAALHGAKAVVVLWSPRSVGSRWVRSEATIAEQNKTLLPVTIEPCRRPVMFELTQTADLSHWNGAAEDPAWLAFIADVRAFVGQDAAPAPSSAGSPSPRHAPGQVSIVVLPFANMSRDEDQEYFADGITEDIITDLSKVSALSVVARNTAFTFKGKHVDVPQVARQLGVTHVLEGSVRKAGNRVRITAQLIHGADGDHLWAERYDRDLDDIFELQDEISQAIVKALKIRLLPEEKKAIANRGTDSAEAYDLFLRARALEGHFSVTSLKRATELLRETIAIDPNFLPAYEQIVSALDNYRILAPERGEEVDAELLSVEERAMAIAPQDPRVLMIRAQRLVRNCDYWNAEQLMMQLPDDFDTGLLWLSKEMFPAYLGRFEETLPWLRRAVKADPLDRILRWQFRDILDITRRPDEAIAENERSRDLPGDRSFVELCTLMRMKGRAPPEALAAQYSTYLAARGPDMLAAPLFDRLAPVLLDPPAARALVHEAMDDPYFQNTTRMIWLSLLAGFFDAPDDAVEAIRRAYVRSGVSAPLLRFIWMPVLAEARRDLRFKDVVREMGLVEYWRRSGKWGDFARPLGDDDFEIIA